MKTKIPRSVPTYMSSSYGDTNEKHFRTRQYSSDLLVAPSLADVRCPLVSIISICAITITKN